MNADSSRRVARGVWTVLSGFVVESLVFALAVLPAALFWAWHFRLSLPVNWLRTLVLTLAFVPAYLLFAFGLIVFSALVTRLLGWRTPAGMEMRIADMEWPLLRWARYMISQHIVRLFAGAFYRSTPVWTLYLRLNGAKMGRGVFVNSLVLTDHNLLEFGDGVVIGSDVHLSGHTVEAGVVKTAPVRLGKNVTVGTGSVIGIGVEVGDNTQVGALSLIPKHRTLAANAVYVGVPVRRLDAPEPGEPVATSQVPLG
jgi:acetyltransferase-like isoleucine patch superfamily enzyme